MTEEEGADRGVHMVVVQKGDFVTKMMKFCITEKPYHSTAIVFMWKRQRWYNTFSPHPQTFRFQPLPSFSFPIPPRPRCAVPVLLLCCRGKGRIPNLGKSPNRTENHILRTNNRKNAVEENPRFLPLLPLLFAVAAG